MLISKSARIRGLKSSLQLNIGRKIGILELTLLIIRLSCLYQFRSVGLWKSNAVFESRKLVGKIDSFLACKFYIYLSIICMQFWVFGPDSLRNGLPKAVSSLEWPIPEGKGKVYVHCTDRFGRSPAVAITYMFWFCDVYASLRFQSLYGNLFMDVY